MLNNTVLHPSESVKLIKNVLIPMRDGVHLAADLYVPEDANLEGGTKGKYPVVMEYYPYRKDEVILTQGNWEHYLEFPRHGYIVARVDIRGTGSSGGVNTDEYMLQEQIDGYDTIEWLAQQAWCDGHVNMMGISYGGYDSLQVATHNPPHLTSIIPVDFTDDRYTDDCHYRGGLLRKYYDIGLYGTYMIAYNALPPYPEWSGADWAKIWEQHLEKNEPWLLKWLHHQTNDAYWRHGSVRDIPDRIKCPVFLIGGWRDANPNPPLRLFESLRVPRKVLIGPWNHAMPSTAIPGPRIDYLKEILRWLDYWCKGIDTGIMSEPPITAYMQHFEPPVVDRLDSAGEWRAETTWPPPSARELILYLHEGNLLDAGQPTEGNDVFEYVPTVGLAGGLLSGRLQFGLPGDQRTDEAFSLNYTSPPLEQEIFILGNPSATLCVSSSARVIGFAVSLCDVAPDGTSHLVSKGMLNGTRRESLTDPKPLTPGEVYELDIQIDATGWVFPKGHRIRLSTASADWPNVWPTPEPATNHVYRGPDHPSRLILPVVSAEGSARPPRFVQSSRKVPKHSAAAQSPIWQVTHDILTGRATFKLYAGEDFRVDDMTVVHRDYSLIAHVDPRDPAHASACGSHTSRISRPNQVVQGRSNVVVQGTATHFHVTIDLEVRVNEAPHFAQRWVESVPRQLL